KIFATGKFTKRSKTNPKTATKTALGHEKNPLQGIWPRNSRKNAPKRHSAAKKNPRAGRNILSCTHRA
ncbi:MAG: hypothetical protein LBC99_04215, partial [Spirochaetota bacterium]|nr:hypothetical protein [Spirochaetota bacterium]